MKLWKILVILLMSLVMKPGLCPVPSDTFSKFQTVSQIEESILATLKAPDNSRPISFNYFGEPFTCKTVSSSELLCESQGARWLGEVSVKWDNGQITSNGTIEVPDPKGLIREYALATGQNNEFVVNYDNWFVCKVE